MCVGDVNFDRLTLLKQRACTTGMCKGNTWSVSVAIADLTQCQQRFNIRTNVMPALLQRTLLFDLESTSDIQY